MAHKAYFRPSPPCVASSAHDQDSAYYLPGASARIVVEFDEGQFLSVWSFEAEF